MYVHKMVQHPTSNTRKKEGRNEDNPFWLIMEFWMELWLMCEITQKTAQNIQNTTNMQMYRIKECGYLSIENVCINIRFNCCYFAELK